MSISTKELPGVSWRKTLLVILNLLFISLLFGGANRLDNLRTRPKVTSNELKVDGKKKRFNISTYKVPKPTFGGKENRVNISTYKVLRPNTENWRMYEKIAGWPFEEKKSKASKQQICRTIEAGDATESYPQVLPKTVFSNNTRMVFVLGLEGSGHHMFPGLLAKCRRCRCVNEWNSRDSRHFLPSRRFSQGGIWGGHISRNVLERELNLFFQSMPFLRKKYSSEANEGNPDKYTYFINSFCWKNVGMLSYPNGMGPCHRLQSPDIRILAEMLEYVGVDLRIVVLYRNPLDVLLSTVNHKQIGPWEANALNYREIVSHAIMDQQLLRMDKRFFKCLNYDELPKLDETIGDFLNVDDDRFKFADAVKDSYVQLVEPEKRREEQRRAMSNTRKAELYDLLNQEMERLRKFCKF